MTDSPTEDECDCSETTTANGSDDAVLVPHGVMRGIADIVNGDTADTTDIENVLKFS